MVGKSAKVVKENKKSEIDKVGMTNVVRGRQKRIKISEAIVDGNTVQMPFLVPYKGTPITLVEFYWNNVEDGKNVKRGLKVSGHGQYGVPTLKDKSVLMALQNIYIESKLKNGILNLELDETKVPEDELFIDFQNINNIAYEMGYKSVRAKTKENIKKSIERLVATTMINLASGGLYDPIAKKYITSSESYRYLEGMENYTFYDCENCLYEKGCDKNFETCQNKENQSVDVTKIKISRFFYKCIANNFKMIYEKDKSNQIKNLVAKNIYLISQRWLDKNSCTSVANISKYIERLPMNTKEDKHKKQCIKEAVEKLNEYDFVKAELVGDLVKVTHLDKTRRAKLPTKNKIIDDSYLKNKYNTYKEIEEKLKEYGFTDQELTIYLSLEMLQHIRYIQALMRYTEILNGYGKIKDVKAYLKTGLTYTSDKTPYNIEEKYYNTLA